MNTDAGNTHIQEVLSERNKEYGAFYTQADISQKLKEVAQERYYRLNPMQREALDMILHKISRILNGNPDNIDNWVDIAGYAQLIVNDLQGKAITKKIEQNLFDEDVLEAQREFLDRQRKFAKASKKEEGC